MSDWPSEPTQWGTNTVLIGISNDLALASQLRSVVSFSANPASTAWPAANRAILVPFRLPSLTVIYQAIVGCGATAAGNFDVGIYDKFGNRIVSGGATAKTNSTEAVVNLTDTTLGVGTYYMALAADGTNNYMAYAPAQVGLVKAIGVRQASTAYVLPATVTFETAASAFVPVFGLLASAK